MVSRLFGRGARRRVGFAVERPVVTSSTRAAPRGDLTLQKELLKLEKQYWQAVKDKDIEACMRLTDDPCIVAGATGVASIDRKTLAYKVREKLTVDGKPVTLEASDASTWVRKNGRWVCALHTESVIGDPYGRDRHPS